MCSREIFTKKCLQQQIFDSDLKGAWHYNHVTFPPIAKNFMLYCRLIYMLSILCVRLTIKVKVGIPESFKVGWYAPQKTRSSHLKDVDWWSLNLLLSRISLYHYGIMKYFILRMKQTFLDYLVINANNLFCFSKLMDLCGVGEQIRKGSLALGKQAETVWLLCKV